MSYLLINGDARRIPLADESVHCCVTSPPYFGLRDYGVAGQIGLESTPDSYVARIVKVFREVRRVLRDDGTLWLNLGDSYASTPPGCKGVSESSGLNGAAGDTRYRERLEKSVGSKRSTVGANLANCLASSIKGRVLRFGGRCTLAVAAESGDVLRPDETLPDDEFTTLLGVQRITLKQGDDNFRQVIDLLHPESRLRVGRSIAFAEVGQAHTEIILDASDHVGVVITEHDLDAKASFHVGRADLGSAEDRQASLAIEEAREPVTEGVRDGEPNRDALAVDPGSECGLNVDAVHQSIPFADAPLPGPECRGNLRVTSAGPEHLNLSLGDGRVDLAVRCVRHLRVSNAFGSLIHYTELYDQAKRKSNACRSKQELGIPEMVKRALMEDGWICRSTIIWAKPNPMPESVTDRPTKAHEYLFLLAKSERYYFDQEAVREGDCGRPAGNGFQNRQGASQYQARSGGIGSREWLPGKGRNLRTVWTINTEPFPGAHFATYPRKLVEPCVKAGTSERGCCPRCGAPWERVVERGEQVEAGHVRGDRAAYCEGRAVNGSSIKRWTRIDAGWRPTCPHDDPPVPCRVLDPFAGSGTTVQVADGLGRHGIGLDLSAEYLELARRRLSQPHARVPRPGKAEPMPLFDNC